MVAKAPKPGRRPRQLNRDKLTTDVAEEEIRSRIGSRSPTFTLHAFDRLDERGELGLLNTVDALNILKTGIIEDEPVKLSGGWKVIVKKRMPGCREAGVVTVIVVPGKDLIVLTVEWMDWL